MPRYFFSIDLNLGGLFGGLFKGGGGEGVKLPPKLSKTRFDYPRNSKYCRYRKKNV